MPRGLTGPRTFEARGLDPSGGLIVVRGRFRTPAGTEAVSSVADPVDLSLGSPADGVIDTALDQAPASILGIPEDVYTTAPPLSVLANLVDGMDRSSGADPDTDPTAAYMRILTPHEPRSVQEVWAPREQRENMIAMFVENTLAGAETDADALQAVYVALSRLTSPTDQFYFLRGLVRYISVYITDCSDEKVAYVLKLALEKLEALAATGEISSYDMFEAASSDVARAVEFSGTRIKAYGGFWGNLFTFGRRRKKYTDLLPVFAAINLSYARLLNASVLSNPESVNGERDPEYLTTFYGVDTMLAASAALEMYKLASSARTGDAALEFEGLETEAFSLIMSLRNCFGLEASDTTPEWLARQLIGRRLLPALDTAVEESRTGDFGDPSLTGLNLFVDQELPRYMNLPILAVYISNALGSAVPDYSLTAGDSWMYAKRVLDTLYLRAVDYFSSATTLMLTGKYVEPVVGDGNVVSPRYASFVSNENVLTPPFTTPTILAKYVSGLSSHEILTFVRRTMDWMVVCGASQNAAKAFFDAVKDTAYGAAREAGLKTFNMPEDFSAILYPDGVPEEEPMPE